MLIKSNMLVPNIKLTNDQLGKFLTLISTHLSAKSNSLLVDNDINKPVTKEIIKKLFNINNSMYYKLLKSFKETNLIKEIQIKNTNYFIINPAYFTIRSIPTSTSYVLFKEDIDKYAAITDPLVGQYFELYFKNNGYILEEDSIFSKEK